MDSPLKWPVMRSQGVFVVVNIKQNILNKNKAHFSTTTMNRYESGNGIDKETDKSLN